MKNRLISLLLLSVSSFTQANIAGDLDAYFNQLGYASNVTAPAAFQSQAAGFYGGGSLYVRNPVRQYQLVQLDLPSYRAGCGGIDLFTGSMSFLSQEKLVDLGKQVMSNGGAYAVDVMLATTVPELKQVRDYLQSLEQAANQASINSCEMAQHFVGGLFPKTAASQQKICKDQGTMGKEGLFSDYVKARMECSGAGFDKAMKHAANNETLKKQVVLNKNIVWSILHSQSFLSRDKELAEMVMSLTGTLIIDGQGKVTNVPSLAGSGALMNALIGGQENLKAKMWRCQDEACLTVKMNTLSIPETATLSYRIKAIIESINQKLLADEKPTAAEINFLSLTSLPVMKFLSVLNSTRYGSAAIDMSEYASLIAQDLLTHYLSELLQEVTNATAGAELNDDLIKAIQHRIREATLKVAAIEPKVTRKLQEKLRLIEHISRLEKQVASQLGTI